MISHATTLLVDAAVERLLELDKIVSRAVTEAAALAAMMDTYGGALPELTALTVVTRGDSDATCNEPAPTVAPQPAEATEVAPEHAEPTPPAADDLTCHDCGQVCATANGLAIHRARKHKAPPKPKMPPLEDIAAAYKEADEAGRRPIAAIADRWDVDRPVAQEWVNLTRAAGHLPPRDEPQVARTAPARAQPRRGDVTL